MTFPSPRICAVFVKNCSKNHVIATILAPVMRPAPDQRPYRRSPIKRNVKRKLSPSAQCRSIFCLGIQPNCLNVHSYPESGLARVKSFASSPDVKRRSNYSSLWFHFAVVTAPIVFLKHNKPNRCPPDEWQHMVLSETRGL